MSEGSRELRKSMKTISEVKTDGKKLRSTPKDGSLVIIQEKYRKPARILSLHPMWNFKNMLKKYLFIGRALSSQSIRIRDVYLLWSASLDMTSTCFLRQFRIVSGK